MEYRTTMKKTISMCNNMDKFQKDSLLLQTVLTNC